MAGSQQIDPIAWFLANRDLLMGYLAMHGCQQVAEDVLQEVFLVLQRQGGDMPADAAAGAWVRGITRNLALKALARQKRRGVPLSGEVLDGLEAAATEAEEEDDHAERLPALRNCLEQLGARHRDLLTQRYADGLSFAELASRHGSTEGAVQVMVSRLRSKLAECIRLNLGRSDHGPA